MTLWRTIRTGLAVIILITGIANSALASELRHQLAQESTLEHIQKTGIIKVGFSTFKPWAMKDKTGKFVGFEIDVAKRLASDMGVKIRFIPTKWDGIIPALLTGKFDIIIGGMGITPQRNLKVNFSDPYEFSGMSIVANKKIAPNLSKIEAFNSDKYTVSVRLGTTAEKVAKNYLPKANILKFTDEAAAIQAILNGKATCFISSSPLPESLAIKYPAQLYTPISKPFTKEPIGFAVRKGDPDFINFLNNWIKVTNAYGWLDNRYKYWFRSTEWENQVQ